MKRRTFFKTTALSGSVVALAGVASCVPQKHKDAPHPLCTGTKRVSRCSAVPPSLREADPPARHSAAL